MKRMKKILALAVALVMVLAMSSMVFASDPSDDGDGAPTSGSITVTANYDKQTYTLYKLFDAQITFDDEGNQRAITYTLPSGKSLEGNAYYEVNSNGFIEAKSTLNDDVMKSAEYRAWAKSFGTQVGEPKTADGDNDTGIKWEGLGWGYYFVDTTLGAFITVDTDNPDAEVVDKNEKPSIDKEIVNANGDTSSLGKGDDATDPGAGANEKAIAQIGDPVSYKLTVQAKPGAENYVVTDTLSAGLTPPAANAVTVSSGSGTYSVSVTGQVIKVEFTKAYLDSLTANTAITIEYTATLNDKAVTGEAGNDNTAKLTWGHDNDENYSEDEAKVYTAQVSVNKKDDSGAPLEGAGFVVKNSDNKYYKLDGGTVTWVTSIDAADEHTSNASGAVAAFTGLKNGTYTLVEKTVPDGFNKLADTEFTIKNDDYTAANLVKTEEVTNNRGTELPSTGGIGTTIFYIVGAVLVAGAAIILVTRRKMSAE